MVALEKGIYCNAENYVVFYGYRKTKKNANGELENNDPDGLTWHIAPPPPIESLRKDNGDYSLKWVNGGYVEQ